MYKNIPNSWVDAFLTAMKLDLFKSRYENIEQTNRYMYGSAEVIGLMLCKIMSLPIESYASARLLGRAMQYCNMIRDIAEDCQLGRQYIPDTALRQFGIEKLFRRRH
jgi:phytoene synthase